MFYSIERRDAQSHLTLQMGKIYVDQRNDTVIYANVSYGKNRPIMNLCVVIVYISVSMSCNREDVIN